MAKGSVRKKGKKWYYRYYVEDASGNLVQKECVGTESKSETEKLLRKAMEEYESKKIVAKTENITLGELLDVWVDEELKVSSLSNNTVTLYLGVVNIIKRHPLSKRKLRTVTSRKHLKGFENFHFHSLRHTYTSNLLANGAPPKDVQELLGHSAVSTTMNIYAHATREAKNNSNYIDVDG